MSDIKDIFAKLQSTKSPGRSSNGQAQAFVRSVSSSPSKSPSYLTLQSQNVSAPLENDESNMNPGNYDQDSADRTANLLNLLRFNQSGETASASEALGQAFRSHEQDTDFAPKAKTTMSASVLVDQLTRNTSKQPSSLTSSASAPKSQSREDKPSENPQDFLLKLLNTTSTPSENRLPIHAKMNSQSMLGSEEKSPTPRAPEKETTPIRVFGSIEEGQETPFEPPQVMSTGSMFTYVNPFEQLSASSPRRRSPKLMGEGEEVENGTPRVEILKNKRDDKGMLAHACHEWIKAYFFFNLDVQQTSGIKGTITPDLLKPATQLVPGLEGNLNQHTSRYDTSRPENPDTEAKQRTSAFLSTVSPTPSTNEETIRKQLQGNAKGAPNSPLSLQNSPEKTKEAVDEVLGSSGEDQTCVRDEEAASVRVYNFPMRPFVSIELKSLLEPVKPLRDGAALEIARLKKEFDQVDRNLVTASANLIVYASPRSGGFRLISQESGRFKQVFQSFGERIFNISICKAASDMGSGNESIVATSVSGTVLWSMVGAASEAGFESEKFEEKGLIFPPIPSQDDPAAHSQLKTRAKKSSRHPDFFAIGRGKYIYLVKPEIASQYVKSSKSRVVHIDRYLKERTVRIGTGKAGKDFAFSEDDTVIVSLDKAGKIKFWDIREILQSTPEIVVNTPGSHEISTPILTLSTFSPSDKSWPTSVLFLDKEKPTVKGVALRYLVIGMKQNHILQLWDIALGKAVQEIKFPHKTESDAICSIAYHARTGILVVGHPTRNSIYLIQVSAPRYNLPPMSQYAYIQRLARGLPGLPQPESTAIMSGIRELSLTNSVQLRSLDILSNPYPTSEDYNNDDMTLFEIYTMHSRGVTCYQIKRRDLGWSKEGKTVNTVDAVAERAISVRSLPFNSNALSSEPSLDGDEVPQSPISKMPRETVKEEPLTSSQSFERPEATSKTTKAEQKLEATSNATKTSATKVDKKKKKKLESNSTVPTNLEAIPKSSQAADVLDSAVVAEDAKHQDQNIDNQMPSDDPEYVTVDTKIQRDILDSNNLVTEKLIREVFDATLTRQMDTLYRKFEEDKRVQEAAGAARQDAILRLVSSTLTDNVEKSLSRIVMNSIRDSVLPSLSELTRTSLSPKVFEKMAGSLQSQIQKDIKAALPNAIGRALQDPDILKTITELVSKRVASQVESHISNALNTKVSPHFTSLALTHIEKAIKDVEKRTREQLKQAEAIQWRENSKIDHLLENDHTLTENIHSLSTAQLRLQEQLTKIEQLLSTQTGKVTVGQPTIAQALSPADEEVGAINELFKSGNVVDGTIRVCVKPSLARKVTDINQWIQSNYQTELFDRYFCNQDPNYLKQLSQLLALSISAAVTVSMSTKILERLSWLEAVFANLSPRVSVKCDIFKRLC